MPSADTPDVSADPTETNDQLVPAPRTAEPAVGAEPAGEAAPTSEPAAGLTEREQQILSFERQWWKHAGAKEQAIRDAFGLSATRYYQVLNGLLDNPAAMTYDGVLVARLRRVRSARARTRRR